MQKIMFDTKFGLEQAVLEGRKTMTRRLIGDKVLDEYYEYHDLASSLPVSTMSDSDFFLQYARYRVGETVAIAQSYSRIAFDLKGVTGRSFRMKYSDTMGWNNKMYVKAEEMVHHIKITDIKIERLQDISEEDCLKEGIKNYILGYGFDGWANKKGELKHCDTAKDAFAYLINKISGKGTWESNPWVFCYTFELIK